MEKIKLSQDALLSLWTQQIEIDRPKRSFNIGLLLGLIFGLLSNLLVVFLWNLWLEKLSIFTQIILSIGLSFILILIVIFFVKRERRFRRNLNITKKILEEYND